MSAMDWIWAVIAFAVVAASVYALTLLVKEVTTRRTFYKPEQKAWNPQPYLKFRKGTEITCPECGDLVATANRDIYSCDRMESAAWDGLEKFSRMVSPCCGQWYVSGSESRIKQIHTKDGWVSRA